MKDMDHRTTEPASAPIDHPAPRDASPAVETWFWPYFLGGVIYALGMMILAGVAGAMIAIGSIAVAGGLAEFVLTRIARMLGVAPSKD